MSRPARFLPVAAVCIAIAAVPLSACGDSGGGDTTAAAPDTTGATAPTTTAPTTTAPTTTADTGAEGKQVFASAGCAGCHTLQAAGAGGQVGPNLDQLEPDASTVEAMVTNGGGGMPAFKDQLSGAQIKAVAEYVAQTAGQ